MSIEYLYPETNEESSDSPTSEYCTECCDFVEVDDEGNKICPLCNGDVQLSDGDVSPLNFHID